MKIALFILYQTQVEIDIDSFCEWVFGDEVPMLQSCQLVYERIFNVDMLYKPRKSRQIFCENARGLSHVKTPSRL